MLHELLAQHHPGLRLRAMERLTIVPDIGILASTDPVALDKASYDLVTAQASIERSILDQAVAPGKTNSERSGSTPVASCRSPMVRR